jgi:hypothetical protein
MNRLRPLLWLAAAVVVVAASIIASHDKFFLRSGTTGAWDIKPWAVVVLAVAGAVPLVRRPFYRYSWLRPASADWTRNAQNTAAAVYLAIHQARPPGSNDLDADRFAVSVHLVRRVRTRPWDKHLELAHRFAFTLRVTPV